MDGQELVVVSGVVKTHILEANSRAGSCGKAGLLELGPVYALFFQTKINGAHGKTLFIGWYKIPPLFFHVLPTCNTPSRTICVVQKTYGPNQRSITRRHHL